MKPMLCHRYRDHKDKMPFPCYMQPKLNGVRMLYRDGVMQSRSFGKSEPKTWAPTRLKKIRKALANVPPHFILDGELYVHGRSLQRINSMASVNALEDSEATDELEFHVFDIIHTEVLDFSFKERHAFIYQFVHFLKVKHVETRLVYSETEGDRLYMEWKTNGYEGAIYRDPSAAYGFVENCGNQENRWACIQKRKDFLDADCEIIGVVEGEGKYQNKVGTLQLRFGTKEILVGSGLSDSERERFWENPPIGAFAKINYFCLSDAGIPLHPTIELINELP